MSVQRCLTRYSLKLGNDRQLVNGCIAGKPVRRASRAQGHAERSHTVCITKRAGAATTNYPGQYPRREVTTFSKDAVIGTIHAFDNPARASPFFALRAPSHDALQYEWHTSRRVRGGTASLVGDIVI